MGHMPLPSARIRGSAGSCGRNPGCRDSQEGLVSFLSTFVRDASSRGWLRHSYPYRNSSVTLTSAPR